MTDRKKDHIELTEVSRISREQIDDRFYYEPVLSGHPTDDMDISTVFLGSTLEAPIWISSMTGGTKEAAKINRNLARAVAEFGLGMGLGSCRILLENPEYYRDFDWREVLGEDRPLYANLGIAQMEDLVQKKEEERVDEIIHKLRANGLIIHVNPLQEWMQPEGDRIKHPPIETIRRFVQKATYPVIVKEVGQGMGKESLRELMKLPLAAIEFGAAGGTNFSQMEWIRQEEGAAKNQFKEIVRLGHDAGEMIGFVHRILEEEKDIKCQNFIVSGGINSFLDGYYFIRKINAPAIYGIASSVLQYARGDYSNLRDYLRNQINGLRLATAFLKVKK